MLLSMHRLVETCFIANANGIYKHFSKSIALEDCLLTLDLENPSLVAFCSTCNPITFSTEGSQHRWVPKAFLYDLKRTAAHKKVVYRAVNAFLEHLHTDVDVEQDIALAIYLTYADMEETAKDETLTLSYIPFLDEEPTKTTLPL